MDAKDLAKQRIKKLMKKAKEEFHKSPKKSHRYAKIAWKIKLKTNIRIPKKYRNRICRKCQNYLVPSKTSKVRIHRSKKIIKCKNCGYTKRIPLNK